MAIKSRRFKILEAVKETLLASEIGSIITDEDRYRIQKTYVNRYRPFDPGVTIAPVRTENPPHENRNLQFRWGVVVAFCFPGGGEVSDLTEIEQQLAIEEYLSLLFARTGVSLAPAPIAALNALATDPDYLMTFEGCEVLDGDAYFDASIRKGYDVIGKIIVFRCNVQKPDNSSIGA